MPIVSETKKNSNKKVLSDQEIKNVLKEECINFLQLQFVDINGHQKQMTVHANMINEVLDNQIMLDGSSIKGFRSIETSDLYFHPDKSTFQVLQTTYSDYGVASFFCDIYTPKGEVFEGCPRNNLKRVLKKIQSLGYIYNVGPELEFFLFKIKEDGSPSLNTQDKAGYYDVAPYDLAEEVRFEIVNTLEDMGFKIEASHHEVAYGQHEIDFKYDDALKTADNVITFRTIVRKIASSHGLYATFMPKPVFGINGSGMHCNQSLSNLNGNNVFLDSGKEYELSQNCLYFIGGLLKHISEIVCVTNPLVNSYKRLVPGYEAPVKKAWSPENRSALIRVPGKRGNATRIELRCPDPSANPYLAFAVMVTAGVNGIQNKISPPSPIQSNIYEMNSQELAENSISSLPGSLFEALAYFKKSEIVKEALGEHIFLEYLEAKTREWDAYKASVSQWEIDNYLSVF